MADWSVEKNAESGRYRIARGEWREGTFVEDQSFSIGDESDLRAIAFTTNWELGQLPDGVIIAGMVKRFLDAAEKMSIPVDLRDDGARAYLDHILRERLYRPSRRSNSLMTVPEARKAG